MQNLLTIEEASEHLFDHLSDKDNINHIGIGLKNGKPCIFLNLVKKDKDLMTKLSDQYKGYPLEVRVIGKNIVL